MPQRGRMYISLIASKGGAGKSTIAACLASEWHRRGKRVLLVDTDPQGTCLEWAAVATELGLTSLPTVVGIGDNLRQALPDLGVGYDVVIIDTPGRTAKRSASALLLSDLALIPCRPGTSDVWAAGQSVDLVEQARSLRPDLQAAIILNSVTRTVLGKSLRQSVGELGLPVMATELGQRVGFAECLASGQGITDYAPGTPAALEMSKFVDEIEAMLAGQEVELVAV